MASTPHNLFDVQSTLHFQQLLSQDLGRLSLINFWAPWAAPCAQTNAVVLELAKKYSSVLVLQVEAELQSEITESFDIESVPSFLILRGHVLLARITGADSAALTAALAQHASNKTQPQSESGEALQARLNLLMNQSKTVLFMKGTPDAVRCGFSKKMVGLLRDQDIKFTYFDILTDENVRQGLKKLNNWPTFPQLIIGGEFVGGLDVTQEMVDSGELKQLLAMDA